MGGLIGVEKFGVGKQFPQALAESAFAGGNSPRYPDSWHISASINREDAKALDIICERYENRRPKFHAPTLRTVDQ